MAAGDGGATMIAIGGTNQNGSSFVFIDFQTSGWGARPDRDGVDGVSPVAANLSNVPVEEVELHQPAKVERYGFLPDTEGAGKWRGSLSVVRELRFTGEEAIMQVRSDRRKFPPYGLEGGEPGSPSNNILNPGSTQVQLPTKLTMPIKHGDLLRHNLAGGGGYGDPMQRDPALVLEDVLDGKLSIERAAATYGVVIDLEGESVDTAKTSSRRLEHPHV